MLLRPLKSKDASEDQQLFDGATVLFTSLGPAPSQLEPDVPKPARLKLVARFRQQIREEGAEETKDLAELNGEIVLRRGNPTPSFVGELGESGRPIGWVFELPEEDEEEDDQASPSRNPFPEPSQRIVRFRFDRTQFRNVPRPEDAEIVLELDAGKFHHMEVGIELEIGGTLEAAQDDNDVVDILLTRTNPPRRPQPVTVLLTDEQAQPVPGASFRITSGAELKDGGQEGAADGDGKVKIRPRSRAQSCQVEWVTSVGEHARKLFVEFGEEQQALERRLKNLGYVAGPTLEDNVRTFQCEFRLPETGKLDDIAEPLTAWHDAGTLPEPGPEIEIDKDPFVTGEREPAEDLSDSDSDLESELA